MAMQIDWITVVAQIVNFLILVWLLKRFLYAPVVRAMRRREEHIAERLGEADEKLLEAEKKAETYEEKWRELESEHDRMMREARKEADSYREELREEARKQVEEERSELRRQVKRERERFLNDLRGQIATRFHSLASTALQDLAERSLEEQIATHLTEQLEEMTEQEVRDFQEAAQQANRTLRVVSDSELSADTRRKLTRALHERFGESLDVSYATSDDLVCGLEIRASGRSIMWSLGSYLDDLQQNLASRLEEIEAEKPGDQVA